MTVINKQKFLAELGKLLTFMYEEDRQRAIAMYAKIFEDAPDEQTALQVLGSPTRQAVIVARAYNAKERKLQVEAQSRELEEEEDGEDLPGYLLTIQSVYDQAVPERPVSAPLEDQVSLFDEPEDYPESPLPEEVPHSVKLPHVETPPAAPEAEEVLPELSPTAEEPAEPEDEPEPVSEDEVDAFLASFTIEGDELIDQEAEEAIPPAVEDEDDPESEEDGPETPDEPEDEEEEEEYEDDEDEDKPRGLTKRKTKPLLLILYLLFAIPLCTAGVLLLLVPTVLSLGLAVGVIAAGAALLITAFNGFAVLADILLVLGAALVVLAIGLLLLWLFIWFIGGPIVGLIRGAVRLGRRWCTKEVAA